jgi:serine/threonine-protein kinase
VVPLPDSPWLRYGLAEGTLVAGKYRLQAVLGEGGMGLVLSAHHEALDRTVAIKVLRSESTKDGAMVERFLREARLAANLKSEHVAHVLDVGTLPTGAPFMVLEYLEGADLAAVLVREGRLPVAVACNYVVQACEAVAEAHSTGIVHRDLKPENLYLTKSVGGADLVKVLDFGVSKALDAGRAAITTTGVTLGSPLYMAPEQLRGAREVGPRADVWALGVVLYELLTLHLPFEADTLPDLCVQITTEDPVPLEELRDDVPQALLAVVARCLEKDPGKRYFDAAELAEALAPFAQAIVRTTVSAPIRAYDPQAVTMIADTVPAPPMPVKRSRAWLAVVAVAAVAAGVVLLHHPSAEATIALAAVDAARSSSMFAQDDVKLAPESTPAPATTIPASPAATPPPALPSTMPFMSVMPRAPSPSRPLRSAATPVPASAPASTDDIPAFR